MERNNAGIDPERLMAAVDAIYVAFEELQSEGLPLRYPVQLMGAPEQPAVLAEFTREEIFEASRFMERMGLIVRHRRSGGAPWAS